MGRLKKSQAKLGKPATLTSPRTTEIW